MTAYDQGRRREYATRDDLAANGYEVIRSAGSKTKVDLVAIKPGQILFVQCKRGGALPPAEWNALYTLAEKVNAVPILAVQPLRKPRQYWRLVGPKIPRARVQPMVPFLLDEVAAAS